MGGGAHRGINLRWQDSVGISLDETCDRELVETLWRIMAFDSFVDFDFETIEAHIRRSPGLLRNSDFMTHPVFNSHHSETEMMRYIRALMDKDIALDRAMIPLGSCTMKLNAASEWHRSVGPNSTASTPSRRSTKAKVTGK